MPTPQSGFSLLDWLVTTLVVLALAGVATKDSRMRSVEDRDATRLRDHRTLLQAILTHHELTGEWPSDEDGAAEDGWSTCTKPGFLQDLVDTGILPQVPADPIDDEAHCYRYRVYTSDPFGCGQTTPFFMLAVRRLETESARLAAIVNADCQGRDFSAEYDLLSLESGPQQSEPQEVRPAATVAKN
jgi:hypothetical protein